MSPDIVKKITTEAGYEIIKHSIEIEKKEGNLYYERDILIVMKLKQ